MKEIPEPILKDDQEALNLIIKKALAGSKMHLLALYLDGQPVHKNVDLPEGLQ